MPADPAFPREVPLCGVPPREVPLDVLLERAGAAVARHRRRIAAAHGLTPTALAVLAALGPHSDGLPPDDPHGVDPVGDGQHSDGEPGDGPNSDGPDRAGRPAAAPSHRELAGLLGLSPATLTPVLDALEAAGQVRRERDRADRRVVRLHRTAAGRDRLARAPSARLPRPDPALDGPVRAWLLAVLAAARTAR